MNVINENEWFDPNTVGNTVGIDIDEKDDVTSSKESPLHLNSNSSIKSNYNIIESGESIDQKEDDEEVKGNYVNGIKKQERKFSRKQSVSMPMSAYFNRFKSSSASSCEYNGLKGLCLKSDGFYVKNENIQNVVCEYVKVSNLISKAKTENLNMAKNLIKRSVTRYLGFIEGVRKSNQSKCIDGYLDFRESKIYHSEIKTVMDKTKIARIQLLEYYLKFGSIDTSEFSCVLRSSSFHELIVDSLGRILNKSKIIHSDNYRDKTGKNMFGTLIDVNWYTTMTLFISSIISTLILFISTEKNSVEVMSFIGSVTTTLLLSLLSFAELRSMYQQNEIDHEY